MTMKTMTRKRWLAAVLLLLAGAGIVWACWPDGRLAKAKALQKELFGPGAKSLPPEQRKQKWQELRAVQKQLSPAQREELGAEMRKKRQAEMARYFKMSPKEKARHLDEIIKRQEQMKKSRQGQAKAGAKGSAPPGGPRPVFGSGGDRSPKGRDDRRQGFLDKSTPAERAQFTQFMKDLKDRRAKQGLPPLQRGPG